MTVLPVEPLVPQPKTPYQPPAIVPLGDDGEYLVCFGHIDERLFVCLAIAHYAVHVGVNEAEELLGDLDELTETVAQLHAVQITGDYDEPLLRWHDVTADTDGAFPITVLDVGA
jgi:hypothetical protein